MVSGSMLILDTFDVVLDDVARFVDIFFLVSVLDVMLGVKSADIFAFFILVCDVV